MNWYTQLSFRWKLSLPLLALLLIFVFVGMHTVGNTHKLGDYAKTIAKVHLQEIQLLIQADRDLYQALEAQRSLLTLSPADTRALREILQENAQQAQDRVLRALSLNQTVSPKDLETFQKLFSQWKSLSDQVVNLVLDQAGAQAKDLSYGKQKDAFDALRKYIDELEEARLAQVEATTQQIETEISWICNFTLFTLIIVIGLIATATYHLPLIIVAPLSKIIESIHGIANGDGDLTQRLTVKSQDELGVLSQHFNQFMIKLHSIVVDIMQNAEIVAHAAQKLLQQSTNSQRAVDKQEISVSTVVTAVNELTKAISEVARNTNTTAADTQQVAANTDHVQVRIRQAVAQVHSLTNRIGETTEVMLKLEQQAKEVNSVIDVIRGVADQTNLLALNAAIEAARAGEQGRGFAVVADEVRTLASRTQQSTQDIQNMLETLQSGVQVAVNAMGASNSTTQDTLVATSEAETALAGISLGIKNISNMTLQTASAAEEQSLVTSEIDKNLVEIHNLAADTASDAKRTYEFSQNLSAAAAHMKQLCGHFKI